MVTVTPSLELNFTIYPHSMKKTKNKINEERILQKELALSELKRKGLENSVLYKVIKDNLKFNK